MPRYFFHIRKDGRKADTVGIELSDIKSARHEASLTLAEEMKDDPDQIWNDEEWFVEVTDEQGLILFTVYSAVFSAAAGTSTKPS